MAIVLTLSLWSRQLVWRIPGNYFRELIFQGSLQRYFLRPCRKSSYFLSVILSLLAAGNCWTNYLPLERLSGRRWIQDLVPLVCQQGFQTRADLTFWPLIIKHCYLKVQRLQVNGNGFLIYVYQRGSSGKLLTVEDENSYQHEIAACIIHWPS